jgi:hypothetical protein
MPSRPEKHFSIFRLKRSEAFVVSDSVSFGHGIKRWLSLEEETS